MQSICETYIKELKSAVHYNAYYISKPVLNPKDYADIFKKADTPIGIYLKNLKEQLKSHYNEDLAKQIYNNCFCSNRKSPFSIHMRAGRKITQINTMSSLDIYIDTDKVALLLETGFGKPNSITLENPTERIYDPYVGQNTFYSPFYQSNIIFYWQTQPEFNVIDVTQNNLIPQRNTHINWSLVLGALLLVSICSVYNFMTTLLAISLLLLLLLFVISLACDNTVGMTNHSSHRFFHGADGSQPAAEVESSKSCHNQDTLIHLASGPIDVLRFFKEYFSNVEELDSDNESINQLILFDGVTLH